CSCTTSSDRTVAASVISAALWLANTPTRCAVCGKSARTLAARSTDRWRGPPAKMTPTYDAPSAAAAAASAGRVMPQNLISTGTRDSLDADERTHTGRRIGRRRDGRPHEHGVGPPFGGALDVGARRHAALGDGDDVGGDSAEEA